MPIDQYSATALLLLVSIAAINDLSTRRIPNRLLLVGLVCALALRLLTPHPLHALLAALGGMTTGFAVFLPFYLFRGMAAGDVKLMAVVGAFSGANDTLQIALLSWCAGGVMALAVLLLGGRLRLALGNVGRMVAAIVSPGAALAAPPRESAGSLPYGVAIAGGTVVFLLNFYG
jgi:prepilin peptidase CpaA